MASENTYPSVNQIDDIERIRLVRHIFSTITGKYDFLNHFLSLRQDIVWRRSAVRKMRFFKTLRLLDVATGTSDLAIEAALQHHKIRITGLDFVWEMLHTGEKKIRERGLDSRIDMIQGDALNIPFPRESFDVAAIGFGIRNIPDKAAALREMARVVAPGGKIMVLEMTFPQLPFIGRLYDLYLNRMLPLLAGMVSPNPEAYRYLGDSIMNFPTIDRFISLMEEAGLVRVKVHSMTFGISRLFTGQKPE
jgi:demethylmenaquinone methyltransferase/2-methoxy-6-polyprenyl-1,4-benzoquinol methylase